MMDGRTETSAIAQAGTLDYCEGSSFQEHSAKTRLLVQVTLFCRRPGNCFVLIRKYGPYPYQIVLDDLFLHLASPVDTREAVGETYFPNITFSLPSYNPTSSHS